MASKRVTRNSFGPNDGRPMLRRVELRGLFGRYDYDIEFTEQMRKAGLVLLYGENGTGKTTIMSLLFHMLSPESYNQHRTAVGRIPFSSVRVEMTDGAVITAARAQGTFGGEYSQTVKTSSGEEYSEPRLPGGKRANPEAEQGYARFCGALGELRPRIRLLTHRRVLHGAARDWSRRETSLKASGRVISGEDHHRLDDDLLMVSMSQAARAITNEVLRSRNLGASRADNVYADLVMRLTREREVTKPSARASLAQLISDLDDLVVRSQDFLEFDLAPEMQARSMLRRLGAHSKTGSRANMLAAILAPYVESVRARLDALESIRDTLRHVTEALSSMYLNKVVGFTIPHGFSIIDRDSGAAMEPTLLSSGERQLLMLVATTLASRGESALLMVDEPEISLNTTWQRRVAALLQACIGPTGSSLLMATHSLAIMAPYRDLVARLPTFESVSVHSTMVGQP